MPGRQVRPPDDEPGRARARDDHLRAGQGPAEPVQAVGLGRGARAASQGPGPLGAPVGDVDPFDAPAPEHPDGERRHLPRPHHHGGPPGERAHRLFRQRHAGVDERGRGGPDRRPGADAAPGGHGRPEQRREHRPGGALLPRQAQRPTDLGQHLRFAEDHRVEPGRHREQVLHRLVLVRGGEGLGERVQRDLPRFRQEALQGEGSRVVAVDLCVDLHAVARGEHHGLGDGVAQATVRLREVLFAEREPFQELDGRAAVRGSQAQDGHGTTLRHRGQIEGPSPALHGLQDGLALLVVRDAGRDVYAWRVLIEDALEAGDELGRVGAAEM